MQHKHESVGGWTGRGAEDALADWFYPLYRWFFDEESTFVVDLDRKLSESRMTSTVELYLSLALGVGVLTGLVLWLLGLTAGYLLFGTGFIEVGTLVGIPVSNETLLAVIRALRVPFVVLVTGVVFGCLGFAVGFGGMISVPYYRASEREREINMLLPDAVSYMYSLSVGGLNQIEILQAMAMAEDTYGEAAKEFQIIVQETEYFDTDYRTAIRTQATRTPSDELSQFLTDMLSILNSGGDMRQFLDDKKEKHMRTAKQQQETILETLELFGEMFMTISLFPLLLIIILVIMNLLGNAGAGMLYLTVYGLIPVTGVAFMVLVAAFKWDEPGEGHINTDDEVDAGLETTGSGLFSFGPIEAFVGSYRVFDVIHQREVVYETLRLLREPHVFFRDHPAATLAVSVPVTLVVLAFATLAGAVPTSWNALVADPVGGTFFLVYAPVYLVCGPYAAFRLWNMRSRRAVLHNLSDTLRQLSSANDTGLTLLESFRLVGETSRGKLADEFQELYAKVNYGSSLKEALVAFNNDYRIPRLARTVRLIAEAQEASNHITTVLRTAAQTSENQDDIDRELKSRTRMQVVIIVFTYLTLLGVMAVLKTQFIDTMARLTTSTGASGQAGFDFGAMNTNLLSLTFFHAVTIQAVISGLICGYLRESSLVAGVKYVLALMSVALLVWVVVA